MQVASGSLVFVLQTSSFKHASQFGPFHPAGHVPLPWAHEHVPGGLGGAAEIRDDKDGVKDPIAGRDMEGAAAGPDTPKTGGGSASRGRALAAAGGAGLKVGRSGQDANSCGCG